MKIFLFQCLLFISDENAVMYHDGVHSKSLQISFSGLTTHEILPHLEEIGNGGGSHTALY